MASYEIHYMRGGEIADKSEADSLAEAARTAVQNGEPRALIFAVNEADVVEMGTAGDIFEDLGLLR